MDKGIEETGLGARRQKPGSLYRQVPGQTDLLCSERIRQPGREAVTVFAGAAVGLVVTTLSS